MNDYSASSPDLEPAAPQQAMRVSLPASVPYVTYAIMGTTIFIYLLQVASVWIFGYASSSGQIDWLELYGARINPFIRAGELW